MQSYENTQRSYLQTIVKNLLQESMKEYDKRFEELENRIKQLENSGAQDTLKVEKKEKLFKHLSVNVPNDSYYETKSKYMNLVIFELCLLICSSTYNIRTTVLI